MKMTGRCWRILFLGGMLCAVSGIAHSQSLPLPPKVREKTKALYPLYTVYVHAKMEEVDKAVPIRYEVGGEEYRRWGYMALFQVLDRTGIEDIGQLLKAVLPAYTILYGPTRTDGYEQKRKFHKAALGAEAYLALTRHVDGYWLVAAVLNRHDFAELKTIGERVALTGRDDTIGVRKTSFRLQMNPRQQAYMAAEKQVRAGEMTAAEFDRQFTPEMRQAVFDPNNADLVLGRE
jgi:hypothetical protein